MSVAYTPTAYATEGCSHQDVHDPATGPRATVYSLQDVNIGLILDLQLPRPWADGDEARLLAQTLEQAQLADELGFASVWIQEHHFLEERGHGAGAVPVLGALAARTTTTRLGLSLLSVDPQIRHPAVLAAEVATLDVLGAGRLDVATGVALAGAEVAGLGLVRQTARARWEHATGILARMLAETPFAGAPASPVGPALRRRTVVPRALQRPHPPLWARCDRPADISAAARLGLGALCRTPLEADEAAEWVAEYRAVLASDACVPVGAAVTGRVAVCVPMSVHEDEATAIAEGLDAAHFHAFATAHYERFGEHEPGVTDLHQAFQDRRDDVGLSAAAVVADGAPLMVRVSRDGRAALRGGIGTPAQVADLVRRYADAGVDDLLLVVPSGAAPAVHAQTCASLRLFAREVLPVAADGPPAPSLDAPITAALARRPAPATAPDGEDQAIGALAEAPAAPAVTTPSVSSGAHGASSPGAEVVTETPRAALRARMADRRTTAVRVAVGRTDDRWLERALGSDRALGVIFAGMRSRFVPAEADGFVGTITYKLTATDGRARSWSLVIAPDGARVVPGGQPESALTVLLGVTDFVRLAAGELDPGHLLLSGRMDLRGDFALATRLGAMFGR